MCRRFNEFRSFFFFVVFFLKRSRLYRFIKYDFCTIILMLFGLLLFG